MANYCSHCRNKLGTMDNYCSNCGHMVLSNFTGVGFPNRLNINYNPFTSKSTCPKCKGKGEIWVSAHNRSAADGLMTAFTLGLWNITSGYEKCHKCGGSGKI